MWKVIGVIALVCAMALAFYLPLSSPADIFNTPDENSNYFFAQLYARRGELRVEEPLNVSVDNAIHPRGVNVMQGFLVPESFLGLPLLYGAVKAALDSEWMPVLFVAVFTLFAIYALYQLFLHFFERKVARLTLFCVFALPAFLYWLGRPYMHTILFLDFLVLGWWILVRGSTRWITVSGLLLGGALAMRTSELLWVAVVTALLVYAGTSVAAGLQRARKLKLAATIAKVALGAALVLIPLLFLNQDLYGSAFGTGYSVTESNLIAEEGAVPQLARASFASQLLFPFGLHPFAALGRFAKYAFGGMWWYTSPMLLGILVMLRRRKKQEIVREVQKLIPNSQFPIPNESPIPKFQNLSIRHFVGNWKLEIGNLKYSYTLAWIFLSLYLILSYGSFNAEIFADPKHPLEAGVGAPYLRYWLPIFVFGAPMAARFFVWMRSYVLHTTYYILAVVLMVFLGIRSTVWAGPESWHGIQENLWNFAEARQRAVRATPETAVFIVPRWADRIYFPARRVIVDVEGKDVVQIVRALHDEQVPVFWHRGRGEIKLEPALSDAGLKITRRFDVDPKGKVYEISNFR